MVTLASQPKAELTSNQEESIKCLINKVQSKTQRVCGQLRPRTETSYSKWFHILGTRCSILKSEVIFLLLTSTSKFFNNDYTFPSMGRENANKLISMSYDYKITTKSLLVLTLCSLLLPNPYFHNIYFQKYESQFPIAHIKFGISSVSIYVFINVSCISFT